jgi:hypothetical protein
MIGRLMNVEPLVEWELAGETCPSATLSTTNPAVIWPANDFNILGSAITEFVG